MRILLEPDLVVYILFDLALYLLSLGKKIIVYRLACLINLLAYNLDSTTADYAWFAGELAQMVSTQYQPDLYIMRLSSWLFGI
jgi:hypothetical protein